MDCEASDVSAKRLTGGCSQLLPPPEGNLLLHSSLDSPDCHSVSILKKSQTEQVCATGCFTPYILSAY